MSTVQPHHIIAIGASAGGLDEINAFFDHTPLDRVSYVIVQHLSPDFKSRMLELVARHSKLAVREAVNEMPVESNLVYLIPNDKFMTIHNNKLYLTDKENVKGPHLRSCLEIDFAIAVVDKCIKRPLLIGEVFTNCE
jgi:two-component system CheB/CheR fusion protein